MKNHIITILVLIAFGLFVWSNVLFNMWPGILLIIGFILFMLYIAVYDFVDDVRNNRPGRIDGP